MCGHECDCNWLFVSKIPFDMSCCEMCPLCSKRIAKPAIDHHIESCHTAVMSMSIPHYGDLSSADSHLRSAAA